MVIRLTLRTWADGWTGKRRPGDERPALRKRWIWVASGVAVVLVASLTLAVPRLLGLEPHIDIGPVDVPARADHIVVSRAALAAAPTSGPAWSAMVAVADGDLGAPDLADQDNLHAGRTFAAALVYARTADPSYRDKVVGQLRQLPQTPLSGARSLSVGRQLAGYVIAADLVDYRDPMFGGFVSALRTAELGGHGRWVNVAQTSEDTASNWGAWTLASRIAISLYLGDTADVARAAQVLRGFTGDRSAYAGFRKTQDFDPGWSCDAEAWVPINPASCGFRGGALVEDISRSGGVAPETDSVGLTYSWETLGGATLSATLLARGGYPDVWEWGDQALLRATQFLQRSGGYPPRYSVNQYIPWVIGRAYAVEFVPEVPAGLGRQFGFTDWLPF